MEWRIDMNFYKHLSIHSKILLVLLLLFISLSVFTTVILINNNITETRNLNTLFNDIIINASTINSGMLDHKVELIDEGLANLQLNFNIKKADLFTYDGKKFSLYNPVKKINFLQSNIVNNSTDNLLFSLIQNDLELIFPIIAHDQTIGAIHISAKNINRDLMSVIQIIVLITLIAIFIALYSEKKITAPLESLVNAMRIVTQQNDYSIRVKKENNDEIGVLVDNFNSMLETIQSNEKLQRVSQEQIKKLAFYDAVTGLPNRDFFKKLLKQELLNAKIKNEKSALFYFSFDNLNLINDAFDHDTCNHVLKEILTQLSTHIYTSSQQCDINLENRMILIGRISREEFAILVNDIQDIDEITKIANKILFLIKKPQLCKKTEVIMSTSMGIAIYPSDAQNAEGLLKKSAIAMSAAQQTELTNFELYHVEMNKNVTKRMNLESALRKALNKKELLLYYQPKFDLKNKSIIGMEALLRWRYPEKGIIPPDEFIPIAEETGLIIEIGAWVIKEACNQCKAFQLAGFPELSVSVNVSGRQFADPALITYIKEALDSSELQAKYLDIELTESIIMMNDETTIRILQELKNIGTQISIDDFGTGYSSFRYLSTYPITTIKIDKVFIQYLLDNKNNIMITKMIINLAHSLNLNVVAEGVEKLDQLEYLQALNCDVIQGYFISMPILAAEFPGLFAKIRMQYHER